MVVKMLLNTDIQKINQMVLNFQNEINVIMFIIKNLLN